MMQQEPMFGRTPQQMGDWLDNSPQAVLDGYHPEMIALMRSFANRGAPQQTAPKAPDPWALAPQQARPFTPVQQQPYKPLPQMGQMGRTGQMQGLLSMFGQNRQFSPMMGMQNRKYPAGLLGMLGGMNGRTS